MRDGIMARHCRENENRRALETLQPKTGDARWTPALEQECKPEPLSAKEMAVSFQI
jgi:hypothetical protein